MLNKFFSTTRPAGYVLIALVLLITYSLKLFSDISWLSNPVDIIEKTGLFICIVLSVLLVQFISVKNNLNSNSLYSLYFYSCFLILFSSYMDNAQLILSNLCILLGLRRIFSLHSLLVPKQKIFDASIWFLIAMLLNSWSVLFLLMIYFAIIWYASNDYRNWLIPIIAISIVAILFYSYCLFYNIDFIDFWSQKFHYSLNFYYFDNDYQRVALSLFVAFCFLFITTQAKLINRVALNQQAIYKNVLGCFAIGAVIYLIGFPKSNSLLVYTFFPLSIAAGNFVLNIDQKWIKESILIGILIVSMFIFLMQL